MTREEAKSCIYTIGTLKRLAYNIHGVMDVIDADNCNKIIKSLEQEPKVGEWLKNGELCKCSRCGSNVLFSAVKLYNYCYRCGAKMEVKE